jgi:hypothetical protein
MFKRWINWLRGDAASDPVRPPQPRKPAPAHAAQRARSAPSAAASQRPVNHDIGHRLEGRIESVGPGKNVLVRDGETTADTDAQETLQLLDDSPLDPSEPVGIDPYNSGQFDRSRQWNSRFRD